MAFQILSIGDAEMLYNGFNGAAMIFSTDNMRTLVKIGFLIGLLVAMFQYYFDMRFRLQSVLVAFIVYSAMFVPKDTVLIEDVYTGQVYPVANVPLGIAMPMSIVTTMGVNVTTMFETAFSTPSESSMLEGGYLDSLKTLLKLREVSLGTASSDTTLNGSLSNTIKNYIEGCAMFDINLDADPATKEVTEEKLMKADDLWSALKTTFINRDVMVDLPGKYQQMSCKDAYLAMDQYINDDAFTELFHNYMAGLLGIQNNEMTPTEYLDKSTQALGLVGIDAQNFMRNALMAGYLRDGSSAFIERTAMEQLKLQWSGEQSVFNEIARPFMAFVEVFTVAISPIVAFLATLGILGVTMIARYFQMLIWVSLWGPVLAVCNLYITITTSRIFETMSTQAEANGSSLIAMGAHDRLYETLETWLATGGMLVASVPAIALMLVYGGSNAAVNLASRLNSGASTAVKPERLMPEAVSMGSTTSVGTQRSMDTNTGQAVTGWTQGGYTFDQKRQASISSAMANKQSATESLSQATSAMNQTSASSTHSLTSGNTITDAVTNSTRTVDAWATGKARTIADGLNASEAEKRAITAAGATELAIGANSGKLFGPIVSAKLGASGQIMSQAGIDANRQQQLSDQFQRSWESNHSNATELSNMHQNANMSSDMSVLSTGDMRQKAEQYSDQRARAVHAEQTYQEAVADTHTSGQSVTAKWGELSQRLINPSSNAAQQLSDIDANIFKKGTSQDKQRWDNAKQDARNQLSREGARIPEASPEYMATQRFMALSKMHPKQAEEVFASTFVPTATGSPMKVTSSGQYVANKSMDGIVSQADADDYKAKAHGEKPIAQQQLPGGNDQQQNLQPSGNDDRPAVTSGHHRQAVSTGSDGQPGSAPKYQLSAPSRAQQRDRNETDALFDSNKPFAGLGNDPDAFRRRILNNKMDLGDTGHLAGAALGNEVKAVNQNVVQPAKETLAPIVEQSLYEGRRIVHNLVDTKPTTKAPIATDDLPPVKPISPTKKSD